MMLTTDIEHYRIVIADFSDWILSQFTIVPQMDNISCVYIQRFLYQNKIILWPKFWPKIYLQDS